MTPDEIALYGAPTNSQSGCVTTRTHRRCHVCRNWKELSEFGKDKGDKQVGKNTACKICCRDRDKKSNRLSRALKSSKWRKQVENKYGPLLSPDPKCVTTATHKRCSKCESWKLHEKFSKRRGGLMARCKQCEKHGKLTSLYGISAEQYAQMLAQQSYVCKICGRPNTGKHSKRALFVDHNHLTGEVRGLLCHYCNIAIGSLQDNPDLLRKAADYLEKHK